jgi:hypothetical protein
MPKPKRRLESLKVLGSQTHVEVHKLPIKPFRRNSASG